MKWIVDWSEIDDNRRYLVCPVNAHNGTPYLAQPIGVKRGWEVKRLMPRCYAAIEFPDFDPAILVEAVR